MTDNETGGTMDRNERGGTPIMQRLLRKHWVQWTITSAGPALLIYAPFQLLLAAIQITSNTLALRELLIAIGMSLILLAVLICAVARSFLKKLKRRFLFFVTVLPIAGLIGVAYGTRVTLTLIDHGLAPHDVKIGAASLLTAYAISAAYVGKTFFDEWVRRLELWIASEKNLKT